MEGRAQGTARSFPTHLYTDRTSTLAASADNFHSFIQIHVFGADQRVWGLLLNAPNGQPLAVGTYDNARDFGSPGPGLLFDGRGCSGVTGRFVVLDIAYGAQNLLSRIHVTFEQQCPDAFATRGEVWIVR